MYRQRRSRLYRSQANQPFTLSRSKLDLFYSCPKCFYLDRKLGLGRPQLPSFTLNNAVDTLLKKEFDTYRSRGEPHPIMASLPHLIPFDHPDLPTWRDDHHHYQGACYHHQATNFTICGIVDDVWINTQTQQLHLVDYKATSTQKPINLNDPYKLGYQRQMEIYQYIFRKLDFSVSNTGYFLFANADTNRKSFTGQLNFKLKLVPHTGRTAWIEPLIYQAKKILDQPSPPQPNPDCEYCRYRDLVYQYDPSLKTGAKLKQTSLFDQP